MTLTIDTLVKVTAQDRASYHGGDGKWTKGRWRSVTPPLIPCENGLHVCTVRQLITSGWLGPRIGVVEVAGERIDQDDKTIVERARVVEWLDTWNERSARHFAADCVERVAHLSGDEELFRAVLDIVRLYADGLAGQRDLDAARDAAMGAARAAARGAARAAAWDDAWNAARGAARAAAWDDAWNAARDAQAIDLLAYLNGEKP